MTTKEALRIARQRSRTQRLTGPPFDRLEQVVGWLGAVQAQEYALAKWSVGQRSCDSHDAVVERAIADGTILRTHVLRPTWHFVLPEDIRWMLALTGPRVQASIGSYLHKLGLDEDVLKKANTKIERALRGGNQLMWKELKVVLEKAGIEVDGLRLGFVMSHVEVIGLVCSGARRGKQHTYALLSERAPDARVLDPDDALVELTLRYFASHGPATVKDFFGAVILDGQLAGHWKRTFNKGEILIEAELYQRFDGAQSEALLDAADGYGKFAGLPTSIEVSRL